jgi:hypothetical protein
MSKRIRRHFKRMMAGALPALLLVAAPATAQPGMTYSSNTPTDVEMGAIAAVVRSQSARIASVWPGYWSANEPFVIYTMTGGRLLVADQAPGDGYEKRDLPAPAATAFWRPPLNFNGAFDSALSINGRETYATLAFGNSLTKRVSYYLHENFHTYQRRTWKTNADDHITGLSPVKFVKDPAVLGRPKFVAGVAKEVDLLERALSVTDRSDLRRAMRRYLKMRRSRAGRLPDVQAIERRYERMEGVAEYVGCRAAALSLDESERDLIACVSRQFRYVPSPGPAATGMFAEPNPAQSHMLRWRLYATGGAISLILDRLHPGDWKAKVADGASLDAVLAEAVSASG